MPIFLFLCSVLYYVFLEICSELSALILLYLLHVLFASVCVWLMGSGRWVKGMAVLWCVALTRAVAQWAVTAPVPACQAAVAPAGREPAADTPAVSLGRHLADSTGDYTFNWGSSPHADPTGPDLGNFEYSWAYQIIMLLLAVALMVFYVWCEIKHWRRCQGCEGSTTFLTRTDATPAPVTATATPTTGTADTSAPATATAATRSVRIDTVATTSPTTGTTAMTTPTTATVATQASLVCTVGTQTPAMSVALETRRKYRRKSVCIVKESDDEDTPVLTSVDEQRVGKKGFV